MNRRANLDGTRASLGEMRSSHYVQLEMTSLMGGSVSPRKHFGNGRVSDLELISLHVSTCVTMRDDVTMR